MPATTMNYDEHTPTSTVAGLAALLTAHLLTAAS